MVPSVMASNTSISLDEHFTDFLAREVAAGRDRSASEVVRVGFVCSKIENRR